MGEARHACQLFGPDAFLLREIAAGAEEHVRTRDEQQPEFKAIRFDGVPCDMPVVVVQVDDAHRAPVVMEILDHLDGARLAQGEMAGTFSVGIEQDAEGFDDDFVVLRRYRKAHFGFAAPGEA